MAAIPASAERTIAPKMGQPERATCLGYERHTQSSYILIQIGISKGRRSADLPGLWIAIRPRAQWGQLSRLDNSRDWIRDPT